MLGYYCAALLVSQAGSEDSFAYFRASTYRREPSHDQLFGLSALEVRVDCHPILVTHLALDLLYPKLDDH